MIIKPSKKRRGVSGDSSRAIVKVKDFDGSSAVFDVKLVQEMLDVIKKMDIKEVAIGVDKESGAMLFFMDDDRTIAYALAPREEEK
jgi:hypothetical protein